MKIVAAALVAASLIAGSTGAFAKGQENIAVRVSTAGVNFADADSVAKFRSRVAREVAVACNPGDRLNADMKPDFKCRKSMAAVTETRIAALSGNANSQMAIVE